MITRWSKICILNRDNRHTAKDVVKPKLAKTVEESSIKIKPGKIKPGKIKPGGGKVML
jgi:hypothetical protein